MSTTRGIKALLQKSPSDTVIISALRTPICRSHRGQLRDAFPEELLSVVLQATLEANPQLPPSAVADVAVGVVLSELGGSKASRMALNQVGFDPRHTSLYTVNRACASSLQSISSAAAQLMMDGILLDKSGKKGKGKAVIAAGMESMTRNYGSRAIPTDLWPRLAKGGEDVKVEAKDCIMPMGLTSENVAERYNVSRQTQDAFAMESHMRAARAQETGGFETEIVRVKTRWQEVDKEGGKVGEEREIVVDKDDGVRKDVTMEKLKGLKSAFKPGGTGTAGNSSQISDGAAAVLMMRRDTAEEMGLRGSIMGKFVHSVVVGCAPDEMGVGPALAIPKLLADLGLEKGEVDRWEINEAFASQSVYCLRELGLVEDWEAGKLNPDGGAIALGHPLGATGARMVTTLMHGLGRQGGGVGVVSMCIGTGMGMAGVFVRE